MRDAGCEQDSTIAVLKAITVMTNYDDFHCLSPIVVGRRDCLHCIYGSTLIRDENAVPGMAFSQCDRASTLAGGGSAPRRVFGSSNHARER